MSNEDEDEDFFYRNVERRKSEDIEKIMRRDTIQLSNRAREIRRFRLKVYNFLDHPMASNSVPYHFAIFGFVLIAVVLGATTNHEATFVSKMHYIMEVILAIFFLCEFLVRMWAISADAKYMGWKGRYNYIMRLVCITDIIIITVTFIMLFIDKSYVSENTLDYLRFIQILRLFHIDRQMTTWRLIRNMIIMSKIELSTTYYITFIVALLMANLVFVSESIGQGFQEHYLDSNSTEHTTATFPSLAHAWWFTIVTILTIGYGDFVPTFWVSKCITCVLGFVAYCTFVAASTQISVGLTLLMEEDSKKEYKHKLRNTAASMIQCWFRYNLATCWPKRPREDANWKTAYFKHICYKIYLTEERLNKDREFAKKLKEKLERRRRSARKLSHQGNASGGHPGGGGSWMQAVRKQTIGFAHHVPGIHLEPGSALKKPSRKSSMPDSEAMERKKVNFLPIVDPRVMFQRRGSDTSISSSVYSDLESHEEMESPIVNLNKYDKDDIDLSEIDDSLLTKYRPLLRLFNFLLFRQYGIKFKMLRKSDQLLEIDAQIREQEMDREQHMKELEGSFTNFLGKPTASPFGKSGEKLEISERMDLVEEKIEAMEKKLELIQSIAFQLIHSIGGENRENREGLPPMPPGRSRRITKNSLAPITREESTDPE